MTHTDKDHGTDENALAFAAVDLFSNPLKGEPPQWHELAAWRNGSLDEQRSAEVLSHIANNPDCFQQWLDIVEAESWVEQESGIAETSGASELLQVPAGNTPAALEASQDATNQTRLLSTLLSATVTSLKSIFQQPIPVYGGAFAAVMLALLVAPLLRTGDNVTLEQQMLRSMDAYIETGNGFIGAAPIIRSTRSLGGLFDELTSSDIERLHVQRGMQTFRNHLQTANPDAPMINETWQRFLAELSVTELDCSSATDQSHCTNFASDFALLGQWTLMNAAACQSRQIGEQMSSQYWLQQYSLLDEVRSLPGIVQSTVYSPELTTLTEQTPEALCTVVTSILSTTL